MDVRSPLEVGASAPSFTAPLMSDGELTTVALDAVLPEGPTALAFYPAAFTGGCTDELCAIRDRTDDLTDAGFAVYGISTDLPSAQARWVEEHGLRTPLVSDWDRSIITAPDFPTGARTSSHAGLPCRRRSSPRAGCSRVGEIGGDGGEGSGADPRL
ncbi:MAG: redoxin domain-containing protein, partial [Haloferacaceae archaeon]|nr:redoxin domain-containing protein [Haloferacaceae archaeon]